MQAGDVIGRVAGNHTVIVFRVALYLIEPLVAAVVAGIPVGVVLRLAVKVPDHTLGHESRLVHCPMPPVDKPLGLAHRPAVSRGHMPGVRRGRCVTLLDDARESAITDRPFEGRIARG